MPRLIGAVQDLVDKGMSVEEAGRVWVERRHSRFVCAVCHEKLQLNPERPLDDQTHCPDCCRTVYLADRICEVLKPS